MVVCMGVVVDALGTWSCDTPANKALSDGPHTVGAVATTGGAMTEPANARFTVDVRVVSSTGRNIESEISAGRFREDLYHRLSVVPIRVPPLAERR